jgi:hypothetical protein
MKQHLIFGFKSKVQAIKIAKLLKRLCPLTKEQGEICIEPIHLASDHAKWSPSRYDVCLVVPDDSTLLESGKMKAEHLAQLIRAYEAGRASVKLKPCSVRFI